MRRGVEVSIGSSLATSFTVARGTLSNRGLRFFMGISNLHANKLCEVRGESLGRREADGSRGLARRSRPGARKKYLTIFLLARIYTNAVLLRRVYVTLTIRRKAVPAKKKHFSTMLQVDVPKGRNGKHKQIVTAILADLDGLKGGSALKIPLRELGDTKENVRSALSRASKKDARAIATATDAEFLYVWNNGN